MESVCFTGACPNMKRDELIQKAKAKFEVKSIVTKDLDILVCADPDSGSSKLEKAKKNGTKIISYEDFLEMLDSDNSDEASNGEESKADVLTIEDGILVKCKEDSKSITIPSSIKGIAKHAFDDCDVLEEIIFEGTTDEWNAMKINNRVFLWRLYDAFIPADVIKCSDGEVKIDKRDRWDFDDMYLDEVHWYEEDDYFDGDILEIEDGVLTYCRKFVESVEIPEGITEIGDNAFEDCERIESIVIPEGVTRIGSQAFSGCFSLESIVIPDSVTEIGYEAFSACALDNVEFGSGLKKLGSDLFMSCDIEDVKFNGTIKQWKAIEKEVDAIYDDIVVTCIDGEAPSSDDEDDE